MRVIDAFAGIGGFSLAADALGWETVAFVERDPDCQFWLGQHWPGVPIYGDICAVRWEDAPPCDVFTAGFPCQPHSVAGKRQASADDRDLWSECVRAIGVLRPRYAVLENVPGLLTSESGRFFNRVLSDLAALGYVGRYDVLSAAECGAPHKRERVWIVAHPAGPRPARRQDATADRRNASEGTRRLESERSGRGLDNAHGGRREQRHAGVWGAAIPQSGQPSVGDPQSGGRGAREGLDVRRPLGERDGVGDPDDPRRERLGRPDGECRPQGRNSEGRHRTTASHDVRHAWADAIPYRGADGTVRLIPAQAIAGPEPSFRDLVDGIPDNLAGRHAAQEGSSSLWPVTDSEPGRVARLRAVGNAVVPAWVLAGPFRYILDRESSR